MTTNALTAALMHAVRGKLADVWEAAAQIADESSCSAPCGHDACHVADRLAQRYRDEATGVLACAPGCWECGGGS